MSLLDQRLETMPAGNPRSALGVDAAGLPVLFPTWSVLAASAVAASHTGSTAEVVLATIPVPAGAMGPNGVLRVTYLWGATNNANGKTPRVRLGGIAGSTFLQSGIANAASWQGETIIRNRNNPALQVGHNPGAFSFSSTTGAVMTAAVNTAVAQDLVITGQLANAADTISLESYIVELLQGA